LTDGLANRGMAQLDDIIHIMSRREIPIQRLNGLNGLSSALDVQGQSVDKKDIVGAELVIETSHPIQVFFIGIGDDADMDIGRMLAEATGAEFQGVKDADLANVLEEFSKYF